MVPFTKLLVHYLELFLVLFFQKLILDMLFRVKDFKLNFVFGTASCIDIVDIISIRTWSPLSLVIFLKSSFFFSSLFGFDLSLFGVTLFDPCSSIGKRVILIFFGYNVVFFFFRRIIFLFFLLDIFVVTVDLFPFAFGVSPAVTLDCSIFRHSCRFLINIYKLKRESSFTLDQCLTDNQQQTIDHKQSLFFLIRQSQYFFVFFDQEFQHDVEFPFLFIIWIIFRALTGPDQSSAHFCCDDHVSI